MPNQAEGDQLTKSQYITLVVRLVVDDRGQLLHGELVDTISTTITRFRNWPELLQAIQEQASRHAEQDGPG